MSLWTADKLEYLSVYLPYIDITFANMKPCFTQEKRAYYKRCRLNPEFFIEHNGIRKTTSDNV